MMDAKVLTAALADAQRSRDDAVGRCVEAQLETRAALAEIKRLRLESARVEGEELVRLKAEVGRLKALLENAPTQ